MKKLFKLLRNLIVFLYIILIVLVIISVLFYNKYGVTVLGNFTIIPISDENLKSKFVLGDLLIVNKKNESEVKIGDEILFYKPSDEKVTIDYSKVHNIDYINENAYEYTVEDDFYFQNSNFIGKTSASFTIPKAGMVLEILQSKQGFFYLGVLPLVVVFVYILVFAIIKMNRRKSENNSENNIEKEEIDNDNLENKIEDENETVISKKEIEVEDKENEEIRTNKDTDNIKESTNNNVQTEKNNEDQCAKIMDDKTRKALIQAKLNSMTDEEKKALVQAKLNSMTDDERKAFIEERKRKMNLN